MTDVDRAADALLDAIKRTEDYERYTALKRAVAENECESAILRRFLSAQNAVQLAAIAGQPAREEDAAAFEALSTLVYESDTLSDYLLARMRVQQLAAGALARVTKAVELDVDLPEC